MISFKKNIVGSDIWTGRLLHRLQTHRWQLREAQKLLIFLNTFERSEGKAGDRVVTAPLSYGIVDELLLAFHAAPHFTAQRRAILIVDIVFLAQHYDSLLI